jgi:quinoprotein glucose dehydrogenase
MLTIVTGWVLVVLGLLLGAGGVWLAALGGSWAYIGLGIGMVITGALLARLRRSALGVYAALLIATLIWALREVGLDRWALIPRGAFFAVVGLWLLTPWVSRRLNAAAPTDVTMRTSWLSSRGWLGAAMVLVILTTFASIFHDPFDVAGQLPPAAAQAAAVTLPGASGDDWLAYGGTGYSQRYSSLTDITPQTVGGLEPAWIFHTGDPKTPGDPHETTFEVTPLKIGDTLYLCSVHDHVIALDAATGQQRWQFDPHVDVGHTSQHLSCRGLAYHDDATDVTASTTSPAASASNIKEAISAGSSANPLTDATSGTGPARCARRIILPTIDAQLFALDAATGQLCTGFGNGGVVNLATNMPDLRPGYYMETSPPVVTHDLLIIGASINDTESVKNPSGVIRAFDVHTGRLVWNWDLAHPDATTPLPPGQLYTPNTPGSWPGGSVDEKLGLVYFPIENQSPDQLDFDRSAEVERLSSSIVALDIATGHLRWVFQGVHNDLWDRDMPAQPTLVDLAANGATVPALIAPTKQGDLYVLDRRTGKPIFPVHELPEPKSTVPGERISATQPSSALNFMPPPLTGRDMWGATPFDQLACRIEFQSMAYEGPYTPPATERTLVYPGNAGVFNWGGVAVDPVRQIMIATPVRLAFTYQLIPRENPTTDYVSAGQNEHWNENFGGRYAIKIGPFMSPIGLPCQQPPWGAIAGVDLRTGKLAWMHRNGTVRDQMPRFLPIPFPMGVASLGGPLVTAGGVAFYSGTLDDYLRAYDVTTGRKLWQARLPAGGQATPMTYRINGKQMVVVAAGGHGSFGTKLGDAIVAYALK